jgi:hypothetical protein
VAAVPIYSTRFIAESGFTGSAAFLVPAGYVAVVRDIDCVVYTSAGATIQAGIGGVTNFWAVTIGVIAVTYWTSWRGRTVLNPGEQLVIGTDAAADFTASGYLLSLP